MDQQRTEDSARTESTGARWGGRGADKKRLMIGGYSASWHGDDGDVVGMIQSEVRGWRKVQRNIP